MLNKIKRFLLAWPLFLVVAAVFVSLVGPYLISAKDHLMVVVGAISCLALGFWAWHVLDFFLENRNRKGKQ